MGNQIKTAFLLGLMTLFIIFIGQMLGGKSGMMFAFVIAIAMNFMSYWYSDKIVLRMYHAREVDKNEAPGLYSMTEELTRNAGLPMPKLYILPEDAPNAFATGRNPEHAAIAVTEGLLHRMERDEVKGVLAHEISHIKNRDILIGSIAATMAGAIMILANMTRYAAFFGGIGRDDDEGGAGNIIGVILLSILAPLGAMIIQMAISRSREYLADQTGARIAGTPAGLTSALKKLGAYSGRISMDANPASAHIFIANPLSGRSLMNLFSTHPPMEERIRRLTGGDFEKPGGNSRESKAYTSNMDSQAKSMWDNLR